MGQQNFTEAIIGIQEKVEEIQSMVIEEPSIYRTFRNCIEYLEKKEMILGAEESLDWLRRLRTKGE